MANPAIQAWLTRQCELLDGVDRGVVLLADADPTPVARWPADSKNVSELTAIANAALTERCVRAISQPASEEAPLGYCLVAVPFTAGTVVGAVAVEVGDAKEEIAARVANLLNLGSHWLALMLKNPAPAQGGLLALGVAALALEQDCFESATTTVVTELASDFRCERVSLGLLRRDAMKVQAISHTATFDARANSIQKLEAAMEEAADQDAVIVYPPADAKVRITREHQLLAKEHAQGSALTVPLASDQGLIGALTFERVGAVFDPLVRDACEDAAALLGPILSLRQAAEVGVVGRIRKQLSSRFSDLWKPGHPRARLLVFVILGLVLIMTFANGDHRVTANATIEGRVQRAIVAGLDGYIAEANARAGDIVARGQTLGRLDDRDLLLERRKWQSRREQLRKEYREALASLDRAKVNIVSARIDQANAQIDLFEGNLERTRLVAPFDGVVVRGDLSQRLGSPVNKGDVLFELAPREGYRVILRVDERDVAYVAPGSAGKLALSAMPGDRLPITVERVTPVASAEDGRNTFRVVALVDEDTTALRPGLEGVAKIDVGRRRLIWIWTHEMFDWIRLSTWSLWP